MADDIITRTLRNMAWQRAKGELASMLETFWDDGASYEKLRDEMDAFVRYIEDNGLEE